LQALEKRLGDKDLFFDPSDIREANNHERTKSLTNLPFYHGGSTRRLDQIEKRKACSTQAELWRWASLAVMTTNRLKRGLSESHQRQSSEASLTSTKVPSLRKNGVSESAFRSGQFKSIAEGEEWAFDSFDEDEKRQPEDETEYQYSVLEEEKDKDQWAQKKNDFRRNLMTRRASENLYGGEGFEVGAEELFEIYSTPQYDPWDGETDRLGHAFDFHILGTSHHDESAQPHVLSPPMMHALQSTLPLQQQGESFWLKYSLVRDGASITTFLQNLRGSTRILMAMETVDGEVFGAFTSSAWTVQPSYYGGPDSFLWKMKHSRAEVAHSVLQQARRETDLEIYGHARSNGNPYFQICKHDKIAVGGGNPPGPRQIATGAVLEPNQFGFGIAFEGDSLIEASSEPCVTFNSPSLSNLHSDGSKFELVNLEVWALTPCITLQEAHHLECNRLFLRHNATYPL